MTVKLTKRIALATVVFVVGAARAQAQADLSLDFAGGPNGLGGGGGGGIEMPIIPGGQAGYGLLVTNNGPTMATGVIVTMTFPAKTSIGNAG